MIKIKKKTFVLFYLNIKKYFKYQRVIYSNIFIC